MADDGVVVEEVDPTSPLARQIASDALRRAALLIDRDEVEHASVEVGMALAFLPDLRHG